MSKHALIALWVGIGVIVFMGLFPPWINSPAVQSPQGYSFYFVNSGYHFIFSPPRNGPYFIDLPMLIVQWVIVASLTLGFVAILNRSKPEGTS